MARWEHEDVSNLDLPDPDRITHTYYGSDASETAEDSAFAKLANNKGFKTYYIKYGRGDLFDPLGADKGKHNRPYFTFRKVEEKVFAYYMEYLSTLDRIFLTRARRALMENS